MQTNAISKTEFFLRDNIWVLLLLLTLICTYAFFFPNLEDFNQLELGYRIALIAPAFLVVIFLPNKIVFSLAAVGIMLVNLFQEEIAQTASWALLLCLMAKIAFDSLRRKKFYWPINWFSNLLLLFILWACFASTRSLNPANSWLESIRYLFFLVLFIFLYNYFVHEKDYEYYFKIFLVCGTFISIVAIYQFATEGLYVPELFRAVSTFSNPNTLGFLMALLIPFVISQLFFAEPRNSYTLLFIITILWLGLLFSVSRSSILSVIVSTLFLIFCVKNKTKKYSILFSLAAFIILVLMIDPFNLNEAIFKTKTLEDRMELWKAGWNMLRDYPLTGVGPAAWNEVLFRYSPPDIYTYMMSASGQAHNAFLTKGAELGVVGLAIFTLLHLEIGRNCYQWHKKKISKDHLWIQRGISAVFLGLLFRSFFESGPLIGPARPGIDIFFTLTFLAILFSSKTRHNFNKVLQ